MCQVNEKIIQAINTINKEHAIALETFKSLKSNIEDILEKEFNNTVDERKIVYDFLMQHYVATISISTEFTEFEHLDVSTHDDSLLPKLFSSVSKMVLQVPSFDKPIVIKNSFPIRSIEKDEKVTHEVTKPLCYLTTKNNEIMDYFKFSSVINELPNGALESIFICDPKDTDFHDFIMKAFEFMINHFNIVTKPGITVKGDLADVYIEQGSPIAESFILSINNLKNEYNNAIIENREPKNIRRNFATLSNRNLGWDYIVNHTSKIDLANKLTRDLAINEEKKDVKKV